MRLLHKSRTLLGRLGVDRAVAYTLVGRGWAVLTGPLNVLLLATFLSKVEQGFYYTFSSILALQVFFELGLGMVVLHLASHEKALLEWTPDGTLQGDEKAKTRLAFLMRGALIWYGGAALLVAALMMPAGLLFFERYQSSSTHVAWHAPWIWLVAMAACNLLVTPLFAILEGCGLIPQVALMRLGQAIVASLASWIVLSRGGGLFAAPVFNTVVLAWGLGWLWISQKAFFRDLVRLWRESPLEAEGRLDWRREVWPFQWKIALSGASSYLIFVLFNPVLFAFHGEVEAGRMGMSLSVMTAISSVALAWVSTKIASFGVLIARRRFDELDRAFFPALWQSLSVVVLGGGALWFGVIALRASGHSLATRVLEPLPLALLILTTIVSHVVGCLAGYLRSHKEEPFLLISVAIGVLVAISNYVLGRPFGSLGMMSGYFVIYVALGLGAGTWIFQTKRRLWHQPQAETREQNDAALEIAEVETLIAPSPTGEHL